MTRAFYNYDKICSYNATYNFITGGRGIGKSYGAKVRLAVKKFLRNADQFILLRRYKEELAIARGTFFADFEHLFPKHQFRVATEGKLSVAQVTTDINLPDKEKKWRTMGFFCALSIAQNYKGSSFPNVKTIIFDEYIIEKGNMHYLPNESTAFNNFYSTVDRWTDKTKVFFLANSVSIMNPYFLAYEIRAEKEWEVRADGFIVAHFPDSEEFKKDVFQTKFGRFIKDTEYGEYAIGNNFADNHELLLDTKDYKARYQYSLECTNGTFSVWHSAINDKFYVLQKRPKSETVFTLVAERMSEDKTYVTFNDRVLAYLRTGFRHGRVTFDTPQTRNTFTEIFKR